jgi:hypothetical protein
MCMCKGLYGWFIIYQFNKILTTKYNLLHFLDSSLYSLIGKVGGSGCGEGGGGEREKVKGKRRRELKKNYF